MLGHIQYDLLETISMSMAYEFRNPSEHPLKMLKQQVYKQANINTLANLQEIAMNEASPAYAQSALTEAHYRIYSCISLLHV